VAPEPKGHQFYCPPTFRFVSKWPSDKTVELKQSHQMDVDQLQMSEALMRYFAPPKRGTHAAFLLASTRTHWNRWLF
jgi:hypothetical protein